MPEYGLFRFSNRLSWSCSPNALTSLVARKRSEGAPLLDLTISNPTSVFHYPHAEIAAAFGRISDFTYAPHAFGLQSARECISAYYADRRQHIPPEAILLTASTSEAYSLLFKLLCDPGDEVLVPVPSYPLFEYLAALDSISTRSYRLSYDGVWFVDAGEFESKISPRTKAIILVNPNNPTGSVLNPSETVTIWQIALKHGLPLILDEVFADYPIIGTAVTQAPSTPPVLTFRLNGLSKAAGMPQMKLGWIAVEGPPPDRRPALEKLELVADTYLSVGAPVQQALPDLLRIGAGVRSVILERVRRNLSAACAGLAGSPAHALHTQAGWSLIVQLPRILPEEQLCAKLIEDDGVIVQPGYFFDMPSEACVVVSLITPAETFAQGIAAIRNLAGSL